uniref:Uncharacterized protein n=1 Tax=Gossypium raimondii TaxID=29730 RepID=A0A0D2V8T5_GOSRA|nr:hypothetical protein B456_013G002600 [Gossypium raimondii]
MKAQSPNLKLNRAHTDQEIPQNPNSIVAISTFLARKRKSVRKKTKPSSETKEPDQDFMVKPQTKLYNPNDDTPKVCSMPADGDSMVASIAASADPLALFNDSTPKEWLRNVVLPDGWDSMLEKKIVVMEMERKKSDEACGDEKNEVEVQVKKKKKKKKKKKNKEDGDVEPEVKTEKEKEDEVEAGSIDTERKKKKSKESDEAVAAAVDGANDIGADEIETKKNKKKKKSNENVDAIEAIAVAVVDSAIDVGK